MKNIKIISLVIGICLINLVNAGLYYNVELGYDRGMIEVRGVNVEFSNYELEEVVDEDVLTYSLKVVGDGDEVLDESFFNIHTKQLYDIGDNETGIVDGGVIELEEVSFEVYVPYYEDGKEIVVYNDNTEELVRRSVGEFSKSYVDGERIIGGDKDEHGCVLMGGYSWCESKQKCLRTWEEGCDSEDSGGGAVLDELEDYSFILAVVLIVLVVVFIYLMRGKKK